MNLSVVIPTYNRAGSLPYTLEALGAQTVPENLGWEVIVVDNNSSDATRAVVHATRDAFPVPVHYVYEPRQGVSHARNAGIDQAKGDVVAFTDDDMLPAPDWVAAVHRAVPRWEADVVGGRILPRWASAVPRWLEASAEAIERLALMSHNAVARIAPTIDMPAVWGGNMAVRREVFDSGHRFDPAWGAVGDKLYRGEDGRLIGDLLRAGHRVVFDPSLLVWHRIQPDRMRRAYFRRLCFQIGEGEGRRVHQTSGRELLGAPLFYYRWTAVALARWTMIVLFRRRDAFDHQLLFLKTLGRLCVCWNRYVSRRAKEHS